MDRNILLLAICTYVVIIIFGNLINKYLRMPWMFTVVMFGIFLAAFGLFQETFHSSNFLFLSKIGMLFFLFTIGVDLELEKIRQMGRYIILGDILLTLTEGLLLGLLFFFVYPNFVNHSFLVSVIAGVAFGTVGEVILLAILKEFGLEHTKFGQLALGIGVFDDIFEIGALALIIALPSFAKDGAIAASWISSIKLLVILVCIVLVTFLFSKAGKLVKKYLEKIDSNSFIIPFLIFLIIFSFFYFSSMQFENMSVIAAIFSGLAVQQFLPEKFVSQYKKPIYFIGNMFLGPFFFLSLGSKISFASLLDFPILIISIIAISLIVRVSLSYLLFQKILGKKQSAVLGVGLCAKFSTSVVSENLLFTSGLIAAPLYSAIMAAFILMKPIIIGVFSTSVASIKDQVK
jgi:Kef-type K+ transport system membrane component KefB